MNSKEIIKTLLIGTIQGNLTHSLIIKSPHGQGKTTTILETIDGLGTDYKYIPNHLTPKGLLNTLERYNGKLIIFDDCDNMLADKQSLSLLRGAVFELPNGKRWVSWISDKSEKTFEYTGKCVFIINKLNQKNEMLKPFLSRSLFYNMDLSRQELTEMMINRAKMLGLPSKVRKTILKIAENTQKDRLNLRIVGQISKLFAVSPHHYQELARTMFLDTE